MTYGPIDFIALEFKGNQFKGEIMPALLDLVNNGTIRVLDLFIIQKDAQGNVTMRELQQADVATVKIFDPLKTEITGMIKKEDLDMAAEKVESNSTAAVMLIENLWAVKFKDAVLNANGRLVMQERIPQEVEKTAPPPPQIAPPPSAAPATGADATSQLQQLAQLHSAGVLPDEQYTAAKLKLLTGG